MTASPAADNVSLSVVIRSRNEADRLRLTLASLAGQSPPAEVVVVNDGSTDHTGDVVAEAAPDLDLKVVVHPVPLGRAASSNAGARVAAGGILLFLDGDTLVGPGLVAAHAAIHRDRTGLIARGETWHLRCTQRLLDPENATPQAGQEATLAVLDGDEREALKVTRWQVTHAFEAIETRAQPGVYPGYGPRRLHELEMDALRHHPDCDVLWAAASGSNLSLERRRFLDSGGFDERLDINEHREMALRLCLAGARVVPVERARSFHLIHRSGWRDPLKETGWRAVFEQAHPLPAVRLLSDFWAGLSGQGEPAIRSLPDLAAKAAAWADTGAAAS